jgi:hypothetical protein
MFMPVNSKVFPFWDHFGTSCCGTNGGKMCQTAVWIVPWSSEAMFDTSHFGRFCMSNCRRSYHLFDRRYTVSYVVIVDWKQKLKRHLLLKDPTIMCDVCNVLFPNHFENSVVYFLNVYINVPSYVCMYVCM